ncbi:CheY-like chemotaxis protein [Microvirga lupini]|uniref:CheY-like chemotaxis protein n=1 Tax=Microvirga lupini TaxID=420324 RepID=A0A7W4VIG1_9HYPH|nr:response regulator [Microvirga lupini]MBB3017340.1 CheY-like chemotaxis protein [Microvirga lupini]
MSAASVTVLPRRIPPTILVVEGDVRIRYRVSDELRAWGFKVLEAGSAPEALTVLDAVQVDLLFLALDLPGTGGGWDVVHHIRERPTKMIVTSRETGPSDSPGPFVRKPYQAGEVAALAARSLNWPPPTQA